MTSIEPAVSQLSGGATVTIHGAGFKDKNIRVFFTAGDSPITQVTPNATIEVSGVYVSETELTCETPNFAKFSARNAVV